VIQAQRRRFVASALWIAAPVLLIAILRPWTVRPLESRKTAAFDPGSFVAAAWPRLLREAAQTAVEVSAVSLSPGASPVKAQFLQGTGVVAAIDRRSRVGVLRVQPSGSGSRMVAIQIGPVVRGTALRDASGFINFSDFTNQFDYAGAANALNDYALRIVVGGLSVDALQGRTILFTGAAGTSPLRDDGAIEIVPVQLRIVEAAGR